MPMYNLECEVCKEIEERFISFRDLETQTCSCGSHMKYVPAFWYTDARAAQTFQPVVIHKDSEGNIRYPGRADAPVPQGFEKVEFTNVSQIRQFEREQNAKDREVSAKFSNAQSILREGQLKENRRVMADLVKNFSPKGKKFYDLMRQASEAREHKTVNPEFYVDAFSNDASNRVAHQDFVDGEWKRDRK